MFKSFFHSGLILEDVCKLFEEEVNSKNVYTPHLRTERQEEEPIKSVSSQTQVVCLQRVQ